VTALFASLRARLQQRVGRWAHRRQGDDVLPVTMQARRVYILPTRTGLGFAVLLIVMLLAGLNYGNSMALLLTFLLAGYTILGIHETQRHIKGLRVVYAAAEDSFAGTTGRIELRFENTLHTVRGPIVARCENQLSAPLLLAPRSVATQYVDYLARRRGRQRLGRIELSATAPLGLFRSWCWLHLPLEAIIYPAPLGARPLPVDADHRRHDGSSALAAGAEEWSALRPFVAGDSPRAVAWKLFARGAPLLVSQYAGAAGARHSLDFDALTGLSVEARLAQLCQWILHCEAAHESYSLRLPGSALPRGRGAAHRQRLLQALALFRGGST
jgi:uncharacterized protein (DUF58 family)